MVFAKVVNVEVVGAARWSRIESEVLPRTAARAVEVKVGPCANQSNSLYCSHLPEKCLNARERQRHGN